MHEMSLAEGIRQIVEDAGRSQGFGKVKIVVLEIGEQLSLQVKASQDSIVDFDVRTQNFNSHFVLVIVAAEA